MKHKIRYHEMQLAHFICVLLSLASINLNGRVLNHLFVRLNWTIFTPGKPKDIYVMFHCNA